MSKELELANELLDFIYQSPTAFHAVESIKRLLVGQGFKELLEEEKWHLQKGRKYYVTKNNSCIAAFVVGNGCPSSHGFKIVGAHTDSPTFRIKPIPEILAEEKYVKLNTEVYGGPILSTWFDRPLALAGRVVIKGQELLNPVMKLVNINRPLLIIPNLAIHMNRDVNKGFDINRQKDTLPLLGMVSEKLEKNQYLLKLLADELSVNIEDILDFDLYLYEYEKGCIIGLNNEFISSGRLDDLQMVHAGLKALIDAPAGDATNVLICYDNEEVGSKTKQGADSENLPHILERIVLAMGKGREEYLMSLAKSFMISCDSAHAVHPNSGEKADLTNRPVMNAGPTIKFAANQSYTSDSVSAAVYEQVCQKAGVPVQKFVNRSDMSGGSTIGPISSSHLDIKSVDMGTPILAMHSIRELGGVLDHYYTEKSFEEFYKA